MQKATLEKYNEKRNFGETPEPEGAVGFTEETNRFVIQKHNARREHYDFRIQVGEALVSWAIPKKPDSNPEVKRLAIKVEDHPLSYIHFEGNIPKGNYGAGTVMVWDIGYYYIDTDRKNPSPEMLQKKIEKGHLKLYLIGLKLKGYYHLVKVKDSDKDEWLFMKGREADREPEDDQYSALTGRNMDEIAQSDAKWESGKSEKTTSEEVRPSKTIETKAVKQSFPGFVEPMLATLTDKPFDDDGWIFELKLDGYRIIAARGDDKTELYSRRGNSYTSKYKTIADELSTINAKFVIDGEVCFVDKTGRADFQKLQNEERGQDSLHYYVFDIIWLNGHDLRSLPLTERKKLLKVLLKDPPEHINLLEYIERDGRKYYEDAEKKQEEGIIAKRANGKYYPGERVKDWLKIKTSFRQEMIIAGYVPSDKAGRHFSSLACAVNENGSVIYVGKVGTGFNDKMQTDIFEKLKKLETKKIRVENPPPEKDIQWVKPELIGEVRFASWTEDKVMRHASFMGLRTDKPPEVIQLEKPVAAMKLITKVKLSNLTKLYWPEEGITKGDVIGYYKDISQVILPYLKDRPQSLFRTPNGVQANGFFQKNVREIAPDWAKTVELDSSGRDGKIEYLLCQDEDTLLYMANLGCIEINPWSSSLPKLDNPDYMIFDLDPVEIGFNVVVKLALEFKKLFDQMEITAYPKTSGSRGIHIYVPVLQKYTYAQVQDFVKIIETHVYRKNKDITSFERMPSARKGRIYLDYLQNAKGKTMATAYSLRPRPGAKVSAPLRWEELTDELDPLQFNILNMRRRLDKYGDLWEGLFRDRIDMKKVIEKLM